MGLTSIEWCDHSINPIKLRLSLATGPALVNLCQKCSLGCGNCYSETITKRFWPKGAGEFPGFTAKGIAGGEWVIDKSKLQEVLRRRKPTRYFWCDMTDMFGEWVPFELIDQCFAVMALTPQHTHLILTKRAERMAEYLNRESVIQDIFGTATDALSAKDVNIAVESWLMAVVSKRKPIEWPLRNVHPGVSVEDQKRADERIPHLLRCPAAVRFLSCEPLLEEVDLSRITDPKVSDDGSGWSYKYWDALTGDNWCDCQDFIQPQGTWPINWVIVGGESGSGARPCHVDWVRSIVQQCRAAGVPCFVKQLGANVRAEGNSIFGWPLAKGSTSDTTYSPRRIFLTDSKGGDPEAWPEDLRVREMPRATVPA